MNQANKVNFEEGISLMQASISRFILASASPRRRELLEQAGYSFIVVPSDVEEPPVDHFESPVAYASHTAWLKAAAIEGTGNEWILAADTVVAAGAATLGKPADRADAERILRMLRGTRHQVITAICLRLPSAEISLLASDVTTVAMRPLADEAVSAYLDTGLWEGKAGAYGIQDHADPFVESIEGSYSNVVGLPMERLAELFEVARRADAMRGPNV